ncbi:MAG TPA: TonB-dependent receptor, partial [Candidatus Sulfotelmatobacter sp.]|nr:TonB-dependent receptor [Candidatus Sulfotelmatobacter sp.]
MKSFEEPKKINSSFYWTVISLVALSCGAARAQTNSVMDAGGATNLVVAAGSSTNVTDLGNVKVVGRLDQARSSILPDLGATAYTHTAEQIESQSQGDDAPINQVILRSPGVAGDNEASDGLHVRGEHANLQYRINDVLLPEGIAGFGSELDPRFIDSMQLITGSLPAQYGFRTAGIVNIQTKSGVFDNGGTAEVYGGSFETIRPSFDYSGSSGKWNYFFDGSYDQNALGIENPTDSHDAIHDTTRQGKGFGYLSYVIDDTSRLTFMGSASYSTFQIPNTPGLAAGTSPNGTQWVPGIFNSASLDEGQREQNYYGVIAYQKSVGDFNSQVSLFGRGSDVHFTPDTIGDLYFDGVASDVARWLYGGGLQADASYALGNHHTLRGGAMFLAEFAKSDSTTTVFPVDGGGNPTGPAFPITDSSQLHGLFTGLYLQDEWKMFDKLTLNYGARYDNFSSSFDNEWQISPRINLIWQPTDSTTLHAGYSRYFTPPPVEDVSGNTVAEYNGTSNESATTLDDSVKSERADYYDVG